VSTLKRGLVHRRHLPTREAARSAVFEHLEAFYNRRRLHSSLGYVSPESY
jgi:transposase InsO family protein